MARWPGRLLRRVQTWLHWRRHTSELAEELAHHFELKREHFESLGMQPADASAAAHRAMGNVTAVREVSRGVWLGSHTESVGQDLTYGLRTLRRQPIFTAVAVLGLSGGLGFAAAAFSGFNAFALRGWNVREPEQLVALYATAPGAANDRFSAGFTLDQLALLDSGARSLDGILAWDRTRPDGSGGITAAPVRAGYFSVLGIPMIRGRAFTSEEDRVGAPQAVVVVSYRYWTTTMDTASTVVGSTVRVKGVPFTVIGVAAQGFDGTDIVAVDAWIPLTAMTIAQPRHRRSITALTHTDQCCVSVGARLAPGASREAAAAELSTLLLQSKRDGVDSLQRSVQVAPFTMIGTSGPSVASETLPVFLLIGGGVAAVLLLACANVANLLLARAASREREIGIRLALGASRGRLVRQLMTESLLLALIAGIPALAIAQFVPGKVMQTITQLSVNLPLAIDRNTIVVTIGLAVVSCVLFGLAPALHATRNTTVQRRQLPLRSVFLSAQVVFCLVLLVSAGLFLRQIRADRNADLGFSARGVTELSVFVPGNEEESTRSVRLAQELPELAASLQIGSVAYRDFPLFQRANHQVRLPGIEESQQLATIEASPEYFAVLGVRLLAGRVFAEGSTSAREVVVNARLAALLGGAMNAIGTTLVVDSIPKIVVGVIPTIRDVGIRDDVPAVYQPFSWTSAPRVIVRGSAEDGRRFAQAIMRHDPSLVVALRSYTSYVDDALSTSIFAALVASAIGVLALVLASVGMFGVFSYWVRQRQHDIGVRMALGASANHVVRMVLRSSAKAVGWGLVLGIPAAAGAAQLLRSSLHGLSPFDFAAFASAVGVLVASAALATALPAFRAVRVDPISVLRQD